MKVAMAMARCRVNRLVNFRICVVVLALSSSVLLTSANTLPDARDDVPSAGKDGTSDAPAGDNNFFIDMS